MSIYFVELMALPWFMMVGLLVFCIGAVNYVITPTSTTDELSSNFMGWALLWTVVWCVIYQESRFMSLLGHALTYVEIGVCFAVVEAIWVVYLFRNRVLEVRPIIKDEALRKAMAGSSQTKAAIAAYLDGSYTLKSPDYSANELYMVLSENYAHQVNHKRGAASFVLFEVVPNIYQIENPAQSNLFKVTILKEKLAKFLIVATFLFPIRAVKLIFGDVFKEIVQFFVRVVQKRLQKLVNYLFKDLLKG